MRIVKWTGKDIKAAFQKEAMRWHPDMHAVSLKSSVHSQSNRKERSERFQSLREAYEVLMDSKKRELYDKGELSRNEI